ncbi:MAG TPA: DUF305 domain-containing protein [Limnobacter sp.]|nr:DUF305 domain-containing protein [Limnobacter sp.]
MRWLIVFVAGVLLGWFLPKGSIKPMDLDIGYAQSMLVHHQQALVMASLVRTSASPPVQALAQRIIQAQTLEMENLKGWLAGQHAPALPADGDLMGWMKRQRALLNVNESLYLARCESSPMGMAGMVDDNQIKRISNPSLDVALREQAFLDAMIEHHAGAVSMSTLPSRAAATPFIRNMAHHVIQTQSREILQMQQSLKRRP